MSAGHPSTRYLPSPPTSTPLEKASAESRQSVANLKRTSIHLALLDPVSSDPSESSPLTKPRFPDGKKTLLSHLKPRGFQSTPDHTAFDRAAAGRTGKGKENERIVKRTGVAFSPHHLESLLAKPSHRYTPYTKRAFVYSAGERQGLTPPSSTTASLIKRPNIAKFNLLSNKQPTSKDRMELDEEYETDDEADSEDVEHLLLSNVRITSSPIRTIPYALSLPTPRLPKSILKQWPVPIRLVKDAIEGCRRNGGRIKHTLNFVDPLDAPGASVIASPYFLASTMAGGKSSAVASGSRKEGNAAGGKKGAVGQSGGPRGSTPARKGGAGGAGGGDDGKRNGTAPTPTADPSITDPSLLFLSPLRTLNASLRPLSAAYIRQQQRGIDSDDDTTGGFVPRSSTTATVNSKRSPLAANATASTSALASPLAARNAGPLNDDSDESEVDDSTFIPILLPQVESAYIALTRCLIKLPTSIPSPSVTFRHLLRYQNQLLTCLDRDITNVTIPVGPPSTPLARDMAPISSSMVGSSSPLRSNEVRRKKGLSASEMRRSKDEVQAALAAIKCIAAICRDPRVYSLFSNSFLIRLVKIILDIPPRAGSSSTVKKDVFPFLAWFFSVQKLPLPIIKNLAPQIIASLGIILHTNDKSRRNASEGIYAISALVVAFPDLFLPRFEVWLPPVFAGMLDFSKNGAMVRLRAVTGLSEMVLAVWREGEGSLELRARTWEEIAVLVLELLHKPATPTTNGLDVLLAHLGQALETDEGPWATQVIALLPAILGMEFRKLAPHGVGPWMATVNAAKGSLALPIRPLASLVWNHLVFSFVDSSASAINHVWLFSSTGKAFHVITQTISNPLFWGISSTDSITTSTAPTPKMILKAQVAGSVFVGLLYGLSSLTRPFFPIAGDYSYNDHELQYLDNIWTKLVRPYFGNFGATKVDRVIVMGWKVLGALLKPVKSNREEYRADLLLNTVLLDGTVARARTVQAQQEVVGRVLEASLQPEQLPGWSARWIVSRTGDLLGEFRACLEGVREEMSDVEWRCQADGARVMPVLLFNFWTDLITIFSKTVPNPMVDRNLCAVFTLLQSMATKMIDSGDDTQLPVWRLLLITTAEILGDRFFSLLSAPKVYAYDSLAHNIIKAQIDGLRELGTPALLDTLLQVTKDDSTRRLGLLVLATKQVLDREKTEKNSTLPVHEADRSTLAQYWTKELRETNEDGFSWDQVVCVSDLFTDHLANHAFDDGIWLDFAAICIETAIGSGPSSVYFSDVIPNHALQITEMTEILPLALNLAGGLPKQSQMKLVGLLKPEINKLAYNLSSDGIAILARALESVSSDILVPILEMILSETTLIEDHSSSMTPSALLLLLTPILRVAFSRVLLDTTQPTQSTKSKTGIEVMTEYWKAHFDNDASLQIPTELVDSLSILRRLEGITVPNLLESQVDSLPPVRGADRKEGGEMEMVVEREEGGNDSLEAPPPGQRASSPIVGQNEDSFVAHSHLDSSMDRSERRSGYNADISLSQATIPASAFGRTVPPPPRQERLPSPTFPLPVVEVEQSTSKKRKAGVALNSKGKSKARSVENSEVEDHSAVVVADDPAPESHPTSSQQSTKPSKRAKTSRAATASNATIGSIVSEYAQQLRKRERKSSGSSGRRSRSNSAHSSEASVHDESMDLSRIPETFQPPRPASPAKPPAASSSSSVLFPSLPRVITAPDEVVRMFFDLPPDDVMALIRTNHGIPTMERLRALGQRATEWVQSMSGSKSSQGSQ